MQKIIDFTKKHIFLLSLIYAGGLFLLNALRIFDNNFWYDETFSIELVTHPFSQVLLGTAVDVHPPLYYVILWCFCKIFGYNAVVYHVVSLIPYLIVLILSLTLVRKRFGTQTSLILITLSSVLDTSIMFNVQVRMYEWGLLFMLLAYLALYGILHENKTSSYVLFAFSALCAAYTHYYLLIAVAFLYLVLIITALSRQKTYFKKTLFTCIATVLLYLPWLFVLFDTFGRTSDSYWITEVPHLWESLGYVYADVNVNNQIFGYTMAVLLFSLTIYRTLRSLNILYYEAEEGMSRLKFSLKNIKFTAESVWISSGLICLFGTIFTGTLVSVLFRPMYITRYIYPVAVIAWLLAGFSFSKFRRKNALTAVFLAATLIFCLIFHGFSLATISDNNRRFHDTMAETCEKIGEGDMIFSDYAHFELGVGEFYYPGSISETVSPETFSEELATAGAPLADTEYYLFLQEELDRRYISAAEAQGYSLEVMVEDANIGTYNITIYQIIP